MYLDTATFEQIAASLAHEVKNPLSLVKANIDLLQLCDETNQYETNYRIMRREIDRINNLLIDFIQIANPPTIGTAQVSINQLLNDLCDSFSNTYRNRIHFCLDFNSNEFTATADEKKLRQVFYNVIKNGIESIEGKYGSNCTNGLIAIDATMLGDYIKIAISDNGGGITDETQEKINKPFYTTKQGGSGLGLFFCKSVVSRHNGTFEIANNAGEAGGCTVTICIPI